MRVDALAAAIAEDRAAGSPPSSSSPARGTTNTGAVDPLDELADLAAREKLWLHVDAAYGGFFLLTEEGKRRCAASSGRTRSSSIPTRGSSSPMARAPCWCATARRCAGPTP